MILVSLNHQTGKASPKMSDETGVLCRTIRDTRIPARFEGSAARGLEDVTLEGRRRSGLPPGVPLRFLPQRRRVESREVLVQRVEGDPRVPTRFFIKSFEELQDQSSQEFEALVGQKVSKLEAEEDSDGDQKQEKLQEKGERYFKHSQYDQQNEKGI